MDSRDWLFTEEFLRDSASSREGMTYEKENDLRSKTVWFIEDLGKQIQKINRRVISCACVFFHRYYVFHSFQGYNRFTVALACLLLASKVEECPTKLREIVNTYYLLRRKPFSEADVKEMHKQILICERLLLCTLNFDLNVPLPHSDILKTLKDYKNHMPGVSRDDREQLAQTCVNFLNDSYRTTLCLRYSPNQIVIGAFFLSLVKMKVSPSNDDTWFDVFADDIEKDSLKCIAQTIVDIYKDDNVLKLEVQKHVGSRVSETRKEVGQSVAMHSSSSSSSSSSNSITAEVQTREDGMIETKEYTQEDEWNDGRSKGSCIKVTYKGATLESQQYFDSIKNRPVLPYGIPPAPPLLPSSNQSTPVFPYPQNESPATFSDFDVKQNGDQTPQFPVLMNVTSDTPEFPSLPGTPATHNMNSMIGGIHGLENMSHDLEVRPMKRTKIV